MISSFNPLSPHAALKHHFTSLKTDLIFGQLKGFKTKISMKLVYQYVAIFFNFWTTSSYLRPLQVENCDSNSRLVVDEDDYGKFRIERVKTSAMTHRSQVRTKKSMAKKWLGKLFFSFQNRNNLCLNVTTCSTLWIIHGGVTSLLHVQSQPSPGWLCQTLAPKCQSLEQWINSAAIQINPFSSTLFNLNDPPPLKVCISLPRPTNSNG